jgi:glycosyltransferase involved in cell wall biosynthesis
MGNMKKIGLSVIIPLYNAKEWIVPTITHIVDSLQLANGFNAEIIVIDDGSSDGSGDIARLVKTPDDIPLTVISQKNTGRYLARKRGVESADRDNILFIDSRVFIDENALTFLYKQLHDNADQIWNAHVNIEKKGNVFARFWDAIVYIGWRRYFRDPKTTAYGLKEFDYYPKGTTMIYMPKKRLIASMASFESSTNDIEFSSDDTLLIRYMVERQPIHISPDFSCIYHGRSTFKKFLLHAYDRGQFFVDGFLRPNTRFFVPLILFLIATPLVLLSIILYPLLLHSLPDP